MCEMFNDFGDYIPHGFVPDCVFGTIISRRLVLYHSLSYQGRAAGFTAESDEL